MAEFTAKDVKALRDATGAGMMDAKKALTETDGDFEAAAAWLRERGLGKAAERADRENAEGAVAVAVVGQRRGPGRAEVGDRLRGQVRRSSSTLVDELAQAVAAEGEAAVDAHKDAVDDLQADPQGEHRGRPGRPLRGRAGQRARHLPPRAERPRRQRRAGRAGRRHAELAHDIAVHIAFGRPGYLRRDDVPADEVAAERAALEAQTRNEGKPEQALPKIVEGKLNGWYKRVPGGVLLEQPYAKDDKQTRGPGARRRRGRPLRPGRRRELTPSRPSAPAGPDIAAAEAVRRPALGWGPREPTAAVEAGRAQALR